MNLHNEHNIQPGVYRHHKGDYYVVENLVTHVEDPIKGDMIELPPDQMLVVYRDVVPITKMINGRHQAAHQVYQRTVKDFFELVNGKPRFTKE